MHNLTKLIKDDMKPALGVTEPGAIAYAVATAASYLSGNIENVTIMLNSGIYKNAFTCGIPNSAHLGNVYAAALGAVAGNPDKGLECLADITPSDNTAAESLVSSGKVKAVMSEISSRIHIEATVTKTSGTAKVTIRDLHTKITNITVNDTVILNIPDCEDENFSEKYNTSEIHKYTIDDMLKYVSSVDASEIDFIMDAYKMNLELFEESMKNEQTVYAKYLFEKNGGVKISDDEQKTASLLCNAAIEARVLGLNKPAMSITGSGAHGIIATLPLYAVARIRNLPDEDLTRATALSYLICMYIKEYSGKLSAFCGCAIAAGSGMACALVYLNGGGIYEMSRCLNNMASSITGMICDGGNHGCTMKGIVAVDAAFRSADLAMKGLCISNEHGINGNNPEDTMRNIGLIASPGMVETEKTIIDIIQKK